MAIKIKRKDNIVQLLSSRTSELENFRITITETWGGPYHQLLAKQDSVLATAKATSLTPTDAGQGVLTVTYESSIGEYASQRGTIEVEWVELRKKLEEHPFFEDVSDADRRKISHHIANPNPNVSPYFSNPLAQKLYLKLLRGQTEYSVAVPVVRRVTYSPTALDAGNAWFRDDPPVTISGGWQFLKTADRITRQGRQYTRTEEWTGAQEWDTDIYP